MRCSLTKMREKNKTMIQKVSNLPNPKLNTINKIENI